MTAPLRLILGTTALVMAAVGGYSGYRLLSPDPTVKKADVAATARPPEADAPATPPPASEPATRVIPERLPDVALSDREGKPRKLTDWAGRPLLINFWATWCAPCRREIPLLKKLRAERREQRLEVIGIAVDFRDAVLEYAREIELDYPLLIGEDDGLEAAGAFGMDLVLPFSVFADSQGRIVALKIGELHADEAAYILDTLREVDSGRVELATARSRIAARLKDLAGNRAVIAPE